MTKELLQQADKLLKELKQAENTDKLDVTAHGVRYIAKNVKALADELRGKEWQPIEKPPFNVYIYSFMTTVHGNTRDFEEEDCDYLAELIEESFDITHKPLPQPKQED